MRHASVALPLLALLASPLAADEAGSCMSGTGLLELPTTATARPGHGTFGLALDNADRDPQGLDLLDYDVVGVVGVTPRLEVYGRGVFSRVVSLPEAPTLPPPPLDLVVAPGARTPAGPLHSLYFPIPYVNKRGTARFEEFVPGDLVLGGKLRLRDGEGWRPAVAVSLEAKIPLTRELGSLQSGAGTGAVDVGGRVTGEWTFGRTSLVASTAYTRVGAPPFGDRLFVGGAVTDLPIRLPNRIDVGIGLRRPLSKRLAAVAELTTVFEVGDHTAIVDQARPIDGLAGIQGAFGHFRFTLGVRYHGHDLASMSIHPSPLAGLVDVTGVADADLANYLRSLGIDPSGLRPGSQRLVAVPAGAPAPPPGARVIPPTYRIRSEHQVGSVLLFGWSF